MSNYLKTTAKMSTSSKKTNHNKIFSLLIILLGAVLMTYMIIVEDELGALPLLLVVTGIVWFTVSVIKAKKRTN